jgi:pimeloyl-ACP methyl ester carboxylesterase
LPFDRRIGIQVKAKDRQSYYRTPHGLNLSFRVWNGHNVPQVLLVHGFGDNSLVWQHFASSLDHSCCALAVDLRGHGYSEWSPTGTYALRDFAADIANVLEDLCPSPVVLAGHSLGAQTAIHVAAACRERIRAVVLVDVGFKPSEFSAGYVRRKFRERCRVYDSVADYIALLHEQVPLARQESLEVLAEGALRRNDEGHYEERCDPMLVNMDDSIDRHALLTGLKQIGRPVLFVRGAGSAVLSRATAFELMAQLPQSRMSSVATAGHAVMLDNPEGFSAAVRPYVLKFSSGDLCEAETTSSSECEAPLQPSSQKEIF